MEEERGLRQPYTKNQRVVKTYNIRKELKALRKQHKEASEEERAPLAELCPMFRKRLLILRLAEGGTEEEEGQEVSCSHQQPLWLSQTELQWTPGHY